MTRGGEQTDTRLRVGALGGDRDDTARAQAVSIRSCARNLDLRPTDAGPVYQRPAPRLRDRSAVGLLVSQRDGVAPTGVGTIERATAICQRSLDFTRTNVVCPFLLPPLP